MSYVAIVETRLQKLVCHIYVHSVLSHRLILLMMLLVVIGNDDTEENQEALG